MATRQARDAGNRQRVPALIILDPIAGIGTTQEDELEHILQLYRERHELDLNATLREVFDPADAERAEIIVFDWGGMSLGNDLLGHQIRGLARWAEDHPGALVIIRSMLSWKELQTEIRDEQLPALANIVCDDGRMQIPNWWLTSRPESDTRTGGMRQGRVDTADPGQTERRSTTTTHRNQRSGESSTGTSASGSRSSRPSTSPSM